MRKILVLLALGMLTIMSGQSKVLFGMTSAGGSNNLGVIFRYDPASDTYTKVFDFGGSTTGSDPRGSLVQAVNGKLYGMTSAGGSYNYGVLFEYDPAADTYAKKLDFDGTNSGRNPVNSLVLASNGKLYGVTRYGGSDGHGVLFEYDPANNSYTKKLNFTKTTGSNFIGSLMQASNGKLYGMSLQGGTGANNSGVFFEYDITTSTYTKILDFTLANGISPSGSLLQAPNGKLYGMTNSGGSNGALGVGVLFEYDLATATYTRKFDFDLINGGNPSGSLLQASNGKFYGMTQQGGSENGGVIFEYDFVANTYTKKINFDISIGSTPYGSLTQASNGKLYGLTYGGGSSAPRYGVLFEYDPYSDTYTRKLDFNRTNGATPYYTQLVEVEINTLAVSENNSSLSLKIVPNPVADILNIVGVSGKADISITELSGRKVIQQTTTDGRVNISRLTKGSYIAQISMEGKQTSVKFIKK